MHDTELERQARWDAFRAHFTIRCRELGALQPDTDTIRDYFDQAIDCNLAIGHYVVEQFRRGARSAGVEPDGEAPSTP
jgi:hypothetical protein